jgi:hypothetical protein
MRGAAFLSSRENNHIGSIDDGYPVFYVPTHHARRNGNAIFSCLYLFSLQNIFSLCPQKTYMS